MPPHTQPVALVKVNNVMGYDESGCVRVCQDGSLLVPEKCMIDLSWAAECKGVFTAVDSSNIALAAATVDGDVCFKRSDHIPVWYSVPREVCKISVNCSTLYVLSHGELFRANGAELMRVHLCLATTPAVADVSTSNTHTLALSRLGKVFACGLNDCNELGSMDLVQSFTDLADDTHGFRMRESQVWRELPGFLTGHVREKLHDIYGAEFETLAARVQHMRSVKFESVHAGLNYSLVRAGGKVLSFGHGQMLGRDFDVYWFLESIMAAEVKFDANVHIESVCAGTYSAHAICKKGCVYAWGFGTMPALVYNGSNGDAGLQAVFTTTRTKKAAVVTQGGSVLEMTQDQITQKHTGPAFSWKRYAESRRLALCMAGHARLGGGSRLGLVEKELYKMIAWHSERDYLYESSFVWKDE